MTRHESRAAAREAAQQAAAVTLNARGAPVGRYRIDRLAAYVSVRNGQPFVVGGELRASGTVWRIADPPEDPDDPSVPPRMTDDVHHLYGEAGRHGIPYSLDRLIEDLSMADPEFRWHGGPNGHLNAASSGDFPHPGFGSSRGHGQNHHGA